MYRWAVISKVNMIPDNCYKGIENRIIGFVTLIGLLFITLLVNIVPAQKLLFDDINNSCGRAGWTYLLDTLNTYGVEVHYVADEGWENIMEMDAVWIVSPRLGYPCHHDSVVGLLQRFTRSDGRIVICDLYNHCSNRSCLNILLDDTRWETTLLQRFYADGLVRYVLAIPPFTDGSESLLFYNPSSSLDCGDHSFPFVVGGPAYYHDTLVCRFAAISYPFLHEGNCSSYIVVVTGADTWPNDYYEYVETTDTYIFSRNILLTAAGCAGYELPPCAVPEPYIISVDSGPPCANTGDTVTLYGKNLWQGSNENIGGDVEIHITGPPDTIIIPIAYSHYAPVCSTIEESWLKFIVPDIPWGNYLLELGHKAITFDGGELIIPCDTTTDTTDTTTDTTSTDTVFTCFAHPSPFTPNGDGVNDYAKFEYPGMHRNEGVAFIYTLENAFVRELRNGEVFDSPKGIIYWDGRDAYDRLMENGVYLYIIQDNGETVCKGTVYLAR